MNIAFHLLFKMLRESALEECFCKDLCLCICMYVICVGECACASTDVSGVEKRMLGPLKLDWMLGTTP